ncbi:MAG: hypothetical protein M3R08_05820, partial [Bacteroidota bacterium]|nr:hypothetical protein [Bacteroidota bacterium]
IQGSLDLWIWKKPFVEITEYVRYNLENTTTYGTLPWYNYLLLLVGIFIPPFSLALIFGFFRRTWPFTIWFALLLFLVIHSYFPNKQERFLLPMIPLFFVLAYSSWEQFRSNSNWWQKRKKMWKLIMIFTCSINIIVLCVLCFSYSKRSRVDTLYALRNERVQGLIIEDSIEGDAPMPPLYYLGQWDIEVISLASPDVPLGPLMDRLAVQRRPNFVLFFGEDQLGERIDRIEKVVGPTTLFFRAEPGLVDRIVHWLNPVNRNETVVVARIHQAAAEL